MADANQIAEQCESVIASMLGLAIRLLKSLKLDRKNGQHLTVVCLYARLVELANSCKALLDKEALAGVPILCRSMFEADIDLVNCLNSKDYFRRMYSNFLEEKIRLTKEAVSATANPFVAAIQQQLNPQEELAAAEKELANLKAAGHTPLSICDRAQLAGRINEYRTVYNLLCLDTHNNIRALESWHVQKTDDDYQVVAFHRTKADLIECLHMIPGILLTQTKALCDFFGTEGVDLCPYYQNLQKLQDAISNFVAAHGEQ